MRKTIQNRILKELLRSRDEMGIPELEKMTELAPPKIYRALHHLRNRDLIRIRREIGPAGNKSPPKGKIFVSLNKTSLKRVRELLK